VKIGIAAAEPRHADELADLYARQRAFLAPFEPARGDAFYTRPGQRARLADLVRRRQADAGYPFVITVDGGIVGMAGLSNVVRAAFQSANLGYWVAREYNGRGVATGAIGLVLGEAFGRIGLHRVEAGTLVDNVGSQRVLLRNGFRTIGLSRAYLEIGGRWRDHILFARTAEDNAPAPAGASDVTVEAAGFQLVARRDGREVGSATIDARGDGAPMLALRVDELERRTRVGSTLVAAALDRCRASGVPDLRADAPLADAGLVVFLQCHGFVAERIDRDAIHFVRPVA
jgi:ribosomal-protein-alanine N-acetyltransferase